MCSSILTEDTYMWQNYTRVNSVSVVWKQFVGLPWQATHFTANELWGVEVSAMWTGP